MERECQLKLESLTKQHEVRLARERETFELQQRKHEEEIENLQTQLRQALQCQDSRP